MNAPHPHEPEIRPDDTRPWQDGLDPEQLERYKQIVDSRVRLLGESYELARRTIDASGPGDYARVWVLDGGV